MVKIHCFFNKAVFYEYFVALFFFFSPSKNWLWYTYIMWLDLKENRKYRTIYVSMMTNRTCQSAQMTRTSCISVQFYIETFLCTCKRESVVMKYLTATGWRKSHRLINLSSRWKHRMRKFRHGDLILKIREEKNIVEISLNIVVHCSGLFYCLLKSAIYMSSVHWEVIIVIVIVDFQGNLLMLYIYLIHT